MQPSIPLQEKRLLHGRSLFPGDAGVEWIEIREAIVAEELAKNLDIDRYRGDYSRTGDTKLDSWGGFLRGEGAIDSAPWTSVNWTTITAYDAYLGAMLPD